MIEQLSKMAQPVLDMPFIRRTRRNHGLEHATVHVLSKQFRGAPLMAAVPIRALSCLPMRPRLRSKMLPARRCAA